MAKQPTTGPLEFARARLLARTSDTRLALVPGLREDLAAIGGAFDEFERRTAALAAFVLSKHYWPQCPVHPAELAALAAMGEHAATRHRVAHGAMCLCADCFPPARVDYGSVKAADR